ncbi:acyltransferase family protein [Sphingomonas sp. AP4-R1]|uniref:acyltransferase family protein n=1 Tax=Sphingomonas sp. AP4-R1 TaxID=2735134 RepID=UPI001493A98E|nr:acyltransferase family protein [Sphingomonas sp. AP4-R1]QJU58192.1 acyltransferase family protein [Sphingomonas sp. AP4-R1]
MMLGLPYHVALLYQPGGWIVAVGKQSAALGWLASVIHQFRMPAFFIVAGYFAAMLLQRRTPGRWWRSRIVRLGVPFLSSILLLVPAMNIFAELSGRPLQAAIREWKHQSAISGGYWVRHLWFLIVLVYLSTLIAGLTALRPSLAAWRFSERLDTALALAMPFVLVGVAGLIGAYEAVAMEGFHRAGWTTDLLQDSLRLNELIVFAPYFLVGFLLQRSHRLLDAFGRFSWPVAAVAAATVAYGVGWSPHGDDMVTSFIGGVAALTASQVTIACARTWFDRPSRTIDRLVAGSFVLYLFHMPVLIGLFTLAKPVAISPAIDFSLILIATMAICWALCLAIERSAILSFLFTGTFPAARRRSATTEADAPLYSIPT